MYSELLPRQTFIRRTLKRIRKIVKLQIMMIFRSYLQLDFIDL
jgi:hypothetical protein